jgi:hypothetical protein
VSLKGKSVSRGGLEPLDSATTVFVVLIVMTDTFLIVLILITSGSFR